MIFYSFLLFCVFFLQSIRGEDTEENDYGTVIGIDLGTTFSCVGVWKGDRVEIISNDQGFRITPSYVAFNEEETLIGNAAKNQASLNPMNTVFDAKRLIGRKFKDKEVQKDIKMLPFKVFSVKEKPNIEVNVNGEKKTYVAEQISAMILSEMKSIAEKYLGEPVKSAVVTVPAYFNDSQRQATKDAGVIAGLNVISILNEPTAAAIAYGLNKGGDKVVLVYDLGGGTFDVSILSISDNFFEVLATAGDTHLGGEDFDQNIMKFLIEEFKKISGFDISKDPRAMQKLRKASEDAKIYLSSQTSTKINIDSLYKGTDFSYTLTRAQFEKLNNALFRKTLIPVRTVLKDADLEKSEIDEIVLVGGSTRIPKIRQIVSKFFDGKEPSLKINPDEAVAYGAAIHAGTYNVDGPKDVTVIDATPLTLGIETVGGVMTVLIPKGTLTPATRSKEFTTADDWQESVVIQVFEGERKRTKDNHFLGTFKLDGIPRARRGVPKIEVTFTVTTDGILFASAEENETGKKIEVQIESSNLSEEEIEKMVQQAEEQKEADELFVKKNGVRNKFSNLIYGLKNDFLNSDAEQANALSETDLEEIKSLCDENESHLTSELDDVSLEEYEESYDSFLEAVNSILEASGLPPRQDVGGQDFGNGNGGDNEDDYDDYDHDFDL